MGLSIAEINVGNILTGAGQLLKDVRAAITGKEPLDANKAAEIALKAQDMEVQVAIAQAQINAVEAAHRSIFVSGWRPFAGWVCGVALAYNYVFMPFFTYTCRLIDITAPPMPSLDMGELITILFGMLGLGAFRAYEKKEGVAAK